VSDDEIVRRLLSRLRNELAYLKTERASLNAFQQYEEDVRLRKAVERTLQVAVEICLDIGRRIIHIEGFAFPETNTEVFETLQREGIIGKELLRPLIEMARFRNLVVHLYERIDNILVYDILQNHLATSRVTSSQYCNTSRATRGQLHRIRR
jgi:uncharacterized protein YutE (UPF0331/DUF86 family)